MTFTDKNGKELLFILSPNTLPEPVRNEISNLWSVLEAFVPDVVAQGDHVSAQEGFHAFHFCEYNKYAEKGYGAPSDVHHYDLKGNKYQRQLYVSNDVKKYPDLFQGLAKGLEDTSDYINNRLKTLIPESYDRHNEYLKILPLGGNILSPPFTGMVVNIGVATDAHRDDGDEEYCVVCPFGRHRKGEIVIYELKLVIEVQIFFIFAFLSRNLTHFNLEFEGNRGSVVLQSDRTIKGFAEDRNGWGHTMDEEKD
ncbi:hypothetical protein BD410DRAFT_735642 [Rickenella mellea]|uniref:Clavaminate synthase-like protein n=1 Tax=Rickenella mellea TaxID=50990 RepID=A0A4Y7PDV7_9AGAM|nr:hypothetical protein BD410DRAFT_735642 [Rickenella mellea]